MFFIKYYVWNDYNLYVKFDKRIQEGNNHSQERLDILGEILGESDFECANFCNQTNPRQRHESTNREISGCYLEE